MASLGSAVPGYAAEDLRVSFGPLQATIPIASIETYVQDGTIDSELAPYARYFDDEQLADIRELLGTPIEVDWVAMANFLYTDPGELLLKRVGTVIRTRKQNGYLALRAAIVLAASSGDGLIPLEVLKHFPTNSLVVDAEEGLSIAREAEQILTRSADAIALIRAQFEADLAESPPSPLPIAPWTAPAPYNWAEVNSALPLQRRAFPLKIYLPERDDPASIVVISHGLGSNIESYRYLADYLASHGFAVVVPEHQGSNANHIDALLTGREDQVAQPDEFVNRALDITVILDELEHLARTEPQLLNRFDFEQIGVIGQSFGGYTALALAGATFQFEHLASRCPSPNSSDPVMGDRSFNLSLILQCRALDLQVHPVFRNNNALRDERVDAVIAINPIGSAIFGAEGFEQIDIPVMIMTGSADVVAPMLWEQLYPFSWLQTTDKFLLMMRFGTHFSTIGSTENDIVLPEAILGPVPNVAQQYVEAMSLAFFQTYIGDRSTAHQLSPTYVNHISQDRMPLSLIRQFDLEQLD
ncbi:MAG: alpha/beta fold hydrolase [Merismopedia sp. SIO2A8]|nr:alpha/beta fold hydrolase [Merismopedia sp. SIO2A8]